MSEKCAAQDDAESASVQEIPCVGCQLPIPRNGDFCPRCGEKTAVSRIAAAQDALLLKRLEDRAYAYWHYTRDPLSYGVFTLMAWLLALCALPLFVAKGVGITSMGIAVALGIAVVPPVLMWLLRAHFLQKAKLIQDTCGVLREHGLLTYRNAQALITGRVREVPQLAAAADELERASRGMRRAVAWTLSAIWGIVGTVIGGLITAYLVWRSGWK